MTSESPPSPVTITKTWRDFEALQALEDRASEAYGALGYPVDDWGTLPAHHLEARARAGLLWVAVRQDAPVGFASAAPYAPYFYLEEIDVDPAAQRLGIGAMLLAEIVREGRRRQCEAVLLRTFHTAPWTVPFYKRHGFRILAESLRPECLEQHVLDEITCGFEIDHRCTMILDLHYPP